MSYEGMREDCPHEGGTVFNPNCLNCLRSQQEKSGTRDEHGVLHAPNGGGSDAYCVGCPIEKDPRYPDGDGRCTVLVRHCPVLNTPAEVERHRREDHEVALSAARARVGLAAAALEDAHAALAVLESQAPPRRGAPA